MATASNAARTRSGAPASSWTSRHHGHSAWEDGAHADPAPLTILTTLGPLATKVIGPGPNGLPAVLKRYGNAEHFRYTPALVTGLDELGQALEYLADRSRSFVIRGDPLEGINRQRCVRHYKKEPVTFREEPRQWLMVDADDVPEPAGLSMQLDPEACVEHVMGLLPEPFHDASCFWQASASAGIKPGCRLHLWFWLSQPITSGQAKAWLRGCPVDRTLYTPIQPHYTADPFFLGGAADPMRRRRGMRRGLEDNVRVPPGLQEAPSLQPESVEITGRELTDGDLAQLGTALRRSRTARMIWKGERTFSDRSTRHFAFVAALARSGVRDPDLLERALIAVGQRHDHDPAKVLRPDYAARTVAVALAKEAGR